MTLLAAQKPELDLRFWRDCIDKEQSYHLVQLLRVKGSPILVYVFDPAPSAATLALVVFVMKPSTKLGDKCRSK
jgi:hypothetical protein